MSRHFFFTVSALLFLSLFGKLAWEVHKESTRTSLNDVHVLDAYFLENAPPYTKQVYEITIAPAAQKTGAGTRIGTLIREIKEDDSPYTKLIIETYNFRAPGMSAESGGLDLQCQMSLNSLIGLQNVEWNVFLRVKQALVNFGLYFHMKAGPPSNDDMPVRSEIKTTSSGLINPVSFLPADFKLAPRSGDAPSQLVKSDDFQLSGICLSPFTQRAGVSLYDNWPVKYLRPEDLTRISSKPGGGGKTADIPYRMGRVVITNEVDARSPASGEPIKAYRAVCKLERRLDDPPGQEEFRLEALYLADGTVMQVQTITGGYRLTASLQHIVVNMKKPEDPAPGQNSSAQVFDKHKLYVAMFPEIEMENQEPLEEEEIDPLQHKITPAPAVPPAPPSGR